MEVHPHTLTSSMARVTRGESHKEAKSIGQLTDFLKIFYYQIQHLSQSPGFLFGNHKHLTLGLWSRYFHQIHPLSAVGKKSTGYGTRKSKKSEKAQRLCFVKNLFVTSTSDGRKKKKNIHQTETEGKSQFLRQEQHFRKDLGCAELNTEFNR